MGRSLMRNERFIERSLQALAGFVMGHMLKYLLGVQVVLQVHLGSNTIVLYIGKMFVSRL